MSRYITHLMMGLSYGEDGKKLGMKMLSGG